MKRAIVLFVVAISSTANIFSQTLSEENDGYVNAFEAEMVVWKGCLELNFEGFDNPISDVVLSGDTLVNGMKWKIFGKGLAKLFVRTEDAKVFVLYPDDWPYGNSEDKGVEILVYDFSLETGDVFDLWGTKSTVTSVDSVELNDGRKHKRIRFNDYSGWIEGVGSEFYYPFERLFPQETMASMPTLMCCHVNDVLLYMNPAYLDCEGNKVANETISEISPKSNISFKDGLLKVTFDGEALFDVAVYNMQGMMLWQTKNNRNAMMAGLDNLPKGVFIVKINTGSYVYSGKIVK
jgi:hypothetical protein